MFHVKIHNIATDQRFEFQAADQPAIDTKLASEPCYGKPAWTEVIPAWTETQDSPTWPSCPLCTFPLGSNACPECQTSPLAEPGAVIEHPATSVEHAAERVVEIIDLAPQELQTRLDEIYAAYEKVEVANITAAGAVQLAEWCQAGNTRALEVRAWLLALYAERDTKLTAIEAGDVTVDPKPSQPWKPWSFREIPKA